jgi:hypothetical protein
MKSITVFCHPAQLYYFFEEEIIEKKIEGLFLRGTTFDQKETLIPVDEDHSWSLSVAAMMQLPRNPPLYVDSIILSDDEDLLCWVKLMAPSSSTPPKVS